MVARLASLAVLLAAAPWLMGRPARPRPLHALWLACALSVPWLLPLVIAGWLAYPAALRRLASHEAATSRRRQFPDLLLALRLAAEDGRGALEALSRIPSSISGPLNQDLEIFRRHLDETFDVRESLRVLRSQINLPESSRLVDALLAGETLGIPLRQTLANQESLVRASRLSEARRRAGYLPYALTVVTGLLFINAGLVFGFPRLLSLLQTFGPILGKGLPL